MGEAGKSLHETLMGPTEAAAQRGKCKSCGGPMEIHELDFKKSTKIMKCTRCGMLHVYKKDIIGKYRLLKAQKIDLPPR